jgi:predicted DNA-binding transcriptional regulator AlpA
MTRGPRPRRPVPPPRTRAAEMLTLDEVCAELRIERSTFYEWRKRGEAPECSKLPNGKLRILRGDLDEWFKSRRLA